MKKNYINTVAFAFFLACSVNSQIQNPGFESWTNQEPDNWQTVNVSASGLITVSQSTDSYSGSSAAKCEVIDFFGSAISPLLQAGSSDFNGTPINQRYGSLNLFYKFTSVSNDILTVNVLFKKNGTAIASGTVNTSISVSAYTLMNVPMNYFDIQVPDSAIIQITINGPNGSDYHIGSVALVDDFSLTGTASLAHLTSQNLKLNSFPNPCSDFVFLTSEDQGSGTIEILDLQGNIIKTVPLNEQISSNQHYQLNISDLPSGAYFCRLNGKQINYQSKIIVQH